jgi:hypothetical protein
MRLKAAWLAIAAAILLGATSVSSADTQTIAPGASVSFDCATELSASYSAHSAVLSCAAEPQPTLLATPFVATPAPTPAPTASPTPAAPAPANVSGITIPSPFAGYSRALFTEFPNKQALGSGPAADTAQVLKPRTCGFRDSSGRGSYCWPATTSEHDGVLDQWLHTESGSCRTSGWTFVHDPNGGCNYVNAPIWNLPDQTDFVVSLVAKFDDIPGRKVAYLRWCGPKVGATGYCEDDGPEGKLDGGDCKGNFFHHHDSSSTQNGYKLCLDFNVWHLYQMHVKPGRFVDFYVDNRLIAHATSGVTTADSFWVGQSETYLAGQTLPLPHSQGHILWDAFAVDLPN